jgi:hypothetical protein
LVMSDPTVRFAVAWQEDPTESSGGRKGNETQSQLIR